MEEHLGEVIRFRLTLFSALKREQAVSNKGQRDRARRNGIERMTMIEIQQAYIDRVSAYHAKMSKRSAGLVFARVKRSARKEATAELVKLGYTAEQAAVIVKDAHDMFLLEVNARD